MTIDPIFYRQKPVVKIAQIIPEQSLNQTVSIFKDAVPYIECQIRSTIQHESEHRVDEQNRNEQILNSPRDRSRGRQRSNVMPFEDYADPSRTEPIAEAGEENCNSLMPQEVSDEVISINISTLLEQAKSLANIDPAYKNDIKAGTLNPQAQGMYLMQDLPESVAILPGTKPNQYKGFDGTLWVDVRKIIQPFITKDINMTKPPTFQNDGIQQDTPGVSREFPTTNAIPDKASVPTIDGRA